MVVPAAPSAVWMHQGCTLKRILHSVSPYCGAEYCILFSSLFFAPFVFHSMLLKPQVAYGFKKLDYSSCIML